MNIVGNIPRRTIEPECELCEEKIPLEIPEEMIVCRVGTGGTAHPMRSDPRIDEHVLEECSEGHDIGALLISANRNDLPEPLEKRKQQMGKDEREEKNRSLDEF